jgi:hypothetical protein
MIKTSAIPQNNNYTLIIPDDYIGKKVEILIYALDEVAEDGAPKTMQDFSGILSDDEYQLLKSETEKARNEWDRAI